MICLHCGTETEKFPCEVCGESNTNPPEKLYAAGGIYYYKKPEGVFSLIKPSGRNSLPYVTRKGDELFGSTQHHAHLYWVVSSEVIILERLSYLAHKVGAPHNPVLSKFQKWELAQAISKRKE